MLRRFVDNYLARHRNPTSQILHLIGVPACFVAAPILLVLEQPWWALAAFVGGYILQFVGHAIEGNDAGETILVKRLIGKPYVEFGPQTSSRVHPRSFSTANRANLLRDVGKLR